MSENIQNGIIIAIVAWAAVYIIMRLVKQTSSKSNGCGGCASNDEKQKVKQ